jgi:hypothetical protein
MFLSDDGRFDYNAPYKFLRMHKSIAHTLWVLGYYHILCNLLLMGRKLDVQPILDKAVVPRYFTENVKNQYDEKVTKPLVFEMCKKVEGGFMQPDHISHSFFRVAAADGNIQYLIRCLLQGAKGERARELNRLKEKYNLVKL